MGEKDKKKQPCATSRKEVNRLITPLDFKEAAAAIPCSERTLRRLHKQGKLEGLYYLVGNRIYFIQDELDKWQRNGGTAAMQNKS
jgi:hypothetical protein